MDIEELFKDKSFQRFRKHFPRTGDLTLIVLKGHLLIEEEINDLLIHLTKNIKHLDKADVTCYQKICLVESLLLSGSIKGTCFETIEKINSLRNKIAHKLEPNALEAKVRNVINCMFPDIKDDLTDTDKQINYLKIVFGTLIGQLSSIVKKLEKT